MDREPTSVLHQKGGEAASQQCAHQVDEAHSVRRHHRGGLRSAAARGRERRGLHPRRLARECADIHDGTRGGYARFLGAAPEQDGQPRAAVAVPQSAQAFFPRTPAAVAHGCLRAPPGDPRRARQGLVDGELPLDDSSVSPRARAARASLTLPPAIAPLLRLAALSGTKLRGLAQLVVAGRGAYARAFENLILVLIVLSVASIGIESIPALPQWALRTLRVSEIVIVAVFTFEYLLRLIAARNPFAFIFSYQGAIDLLAVAPFYLGGFDA